MASFDAAAGDVTFSVLQVYALGLPVHVGTEILSRALISMRDTRTPLFTNIGQLISWRPSCGWQLNPMAYLPFPWRLSLLRH
ncbi:MAG: hypothetical protein R2867_06175 [Caldilineaceae bacterium]